MTETGEIYKKDWWQIEAFKRFQQVIDKEVNHQEVYNLLDLGCGNGVVTKYLASIFPNARILGLDADRKMIEYAQKNNDNERIVFEHLDIRDLEKISEKNIKFDLINANYVLHWLSLNEKEELLKKIRLNATDDAVLMIGTCQRFPNFLNFLDQNIRQYLKISADREKYVHYLSEKGWKNLLEKYGFSTKGVYKNLDIHPILLSEEITNPDNFLYVWLWGASAGKAAYMMKPDNFSEKFIAELVKKSDELYGTEDCYKVENEGYDKKKFKSAVFEEETLFVLSKRFK